MGLFNKKKTEDEAKKETAAAKAPATEKQGPSIHNVKVPAAKAAPAQTATAAKAVPSATKVAAKPATAEKAPAKAAATKSTSTAKASAKTPATKAPAAKGSATVGKTVPMSKIPEGVTIVPRPFFMKTDEDVRLAFEIGRASCRERVLRAV